MEKKTYNITINYTKGNAILYPKCKIVVNDSDYAAIAFQDENKNLFIIPFNNVLYIRMEEVKE